MNNNIHYFIEANSSNGYENYYKSNFKGIDVLKLNNYPQILMNEIVAIIARKAQEKNIELEYIHNGIDNTICGISNPQNKKAVINIMPYCTDKELNPLYCKNKIYNDMLNEMKKAYKYLEKALKIHDEWEEIYISNMNFAKSNILAENMMKKIITEKNKQTEGQNYDRFFGASTIDGSIDYIEDLTRNISKRYLIKGRPGTGKSTFLKKIRDYANAQGYDTLTYHCSFDPKSLDMVIINDLSVCIFDSTSPHEYEPNRANDSVIDLYKEAVADNTDEKYKKQLDDISNKYDIEIAKFRTHLKRAYKKMNDLQAKEILSLDEEDIDDDARKSINHIFE